MSERGTERLVWKEMELESCEFPVYEQQEYADKKRGDNDIIELFGKVCGKPKVEDLDVYNYSDDHKSNPAPEYLIKVNNNTVIVIECKKDVKYHSSNDENKVESLNKPKNYACDGALYYAKYLAKGLDVIAIAISGNDSNWKSTTYFWGKKNKKPELVKVLSSVLENPKNIYDIINGKEISKTFNLEDIRDTAINMNEIMREIKMSEKNKPIFIAGILIALNNKEFSQEYKSCTTFKSLQKRLIDTIKEELEESDIPKKKIRNIKNTFENINDNEKLQSIELNNPGSLLWYINELNLKIKPMMLSNFNADALGVFYHEFIKQAGGGDGSSLGIVLTPQHVTEFMCELANVNKNSIVLDPCCGSAGFLVSAMTKMSIEANQKEINEIKTKQLFGIELDNELYTLAITNMIIRGDGKSNIVSGDCFDKDMVEQFKSKKINVGLINPPYSQKQPNELEFIENLLDIVEYGGKVAAIVPLSCAIGSKKVLKELKKRLMENNTLEAVFTMPDQLFYPTATNTCIMLWTAKIPHNKNNQVYLARIKDDGYVLQKPYGRIDRDEKWEAVKNYWLTSFKDKDIDNYNSVAVKLSPEDEWLAEAYVDTDYSLLSFNDFEQTVKDLIAFEVKNDL